MAKFANVQEYVESLPAGQREIADRLVALIEEALPGTGAVWHGHPVWGPGAAGKSPVCLVKAYPSYVTFGFWKGRKLDDPAGRLEPGAREMASVKVRSVEDIDAEMFGAWLRQAKDWA